jgi:hypothetical protein
VGLGVGVRACMIPKDAEPIERALGPNGLMGYIMLRKASTTEEAVGPKGQGCGVVGESEGVEMESSSEKSQSYECVWALSIRLEFVDLDLDEVGEVGVGKRG